MFGWFTEGRRDVLIDNIRAITVTVIIVITIIIVVNMIVRKAGIRLVVVIVVVVIIMNIIVWFAVMQIGELLLDEIFEYFG